MINFDFEIPLLRKPCKSIPTIIDPKKNFQIPDELRPINKLEFKKSEFENLIFNQIAE